MLLMSYEGLCSGKVGYGFERRRRGSAGGPLLRSACSDGSTGALVTNASPTGTWVWYGLLLQK